MAQDAGMRLLPAGPGKDAVIKVCGDCHGPDSMRMLRLNKEAWSQKVNEMVDRGAQGTPQEIAAVTDYLAANFGPNSKVQVNTAPVAEWTAVLGFTVEEAKAAIAWRDAHGGFRTWQNVADVPGVDRAKVQAKRESMAF